MPIQKIWLEGYKPIEGTAKIVDRLRAAGYELIFLSDNVQERIDYLEREYPFINKFRDGVFSHREGTTKFDGPKLYELALQKASHPAIDCVYIDDKPQLLPPAERLGMKTIQFKSPAQLESELKRLGLKF